MNTGCANGTDTFTDEMAGSLGALDVTVQRGAASQ